MVTSCCCCSLMTGVRLISCGGIFVVICSLINTTGAFDAMKLDYDGNKMIRDTFYLFHWHFISREGRKSYEVLQHQGSWFGQIFNIPDNLLWYNSTFYVDRYQHLFSNSSPFGNYMWKQQFLCLLNRLLSHQENPGRIVYWLIASIIVMLYCIISVSAS